MSGGLSDEEQCWRCKLCGKLIDNCWQVVWDHIRLEHRDFFKRNPKAKPEDYAE